MSEVSLPEEGGKTSSVSMLSRFAGDTGYALLTEVLSGTSLLHDIPDLSDLIRSSELIEYEAGTRIMVQGEPDNDLYLIISGSCDIKINDRYSNTRYIGDHIGEAAMVDPSARRNATVEAAERTVLLKCPQHPFTAFANMHPKIWRRIAVEVSRRLTERTKLVKPPRSEPVMFMGCSTEALEIAREIQASFAHDKFVLELWNEGMFVPSSSAIDDLTKAAARVDFAAFLMTPDDKTISRGIETLSVRDNVLFELGIMLGAIGRERTFLITPRGVETKLPSDLLGVTPIHYPPLDGSSNVRSRLGPACNELRKAVDRLGPL